MQERSGTKSNTVTLLRELQLGRVHGMSMPPGRS